MCALVRAGRGICRAREAGAEVPEPAELWITTVTAPRRPAQLPSPDFEQGLSAQADHYVDAAMPFPIPRCAVLAFKRLAAPC